MLPHSIKKVLRHLPHLVALRFGKEISMDGVKLVVALHRDRADVLGRKVAAALRLINDHAPKHYARVQKFIPSILILGFHNAGAVYISDLKLCDISAEFALSESTGAEQMAMTLVHEATHGYLQSRGVPYAEDRRARIERICVQTEIGFAGRLPQADGLVTEARRRLDYGADYWRDASFLQRDLDYFTKAGMPRFLIRLLERARSRRLQAGRGKKAQPGASPNGGPAERLGNWGAGGGPPSVS
jgi:hypothetical protein